MALSIYKYYFDFQLFEKAPFDNYDIISMFGPQAQILRQIVDVMHNSIIAA